MELIKECNIAIDKEIAEEYRQEAKKIIELTTDKHRQDFIKYYGGNHGNVCCLVLDAAKRDLVNEGKMTQNDSDGFGKPMMFS